MVGWVRMEEHWKHRRHSWCREMGGSVAREMVGGGDEDEQLAQQDAMSIHR